VNVAVVVPYWGSPLGDDERLSLRQLERFLGRYDRYAIGEPLTGLGHKRFQRRYFKNPVTYSRLLLSRRFYDAFAGYEFLLVHQLDAVVFRDELEDWCARGLDYVGAPWFPGDAMPLVNEPAVGNGGLSLRRVAAFREVLERAGERYARRWVEGRSGSRFEAHEDLFWSFDARRFVPEFRVASVEEALGFAFELEPRRAFELAGRRLPFGAHAWAKYDRAFWEPHLLSA
jgi:uncharacterized protein DUF5672